MENVKGLILGEAWKYVQQIYSHFADSGYQVRHWLLKGEQMGVPQKRHRVFFIAIRKNILFDLQRLDMSFNYELVKYSEIKDGPGGELTDNVKLVFDNLVYGEKDLVSAWNRVHNQGKPEKRMWFNSIITYDDDVMQTVAGDHGQLFDYSAKAKVSDKSVANASTFPQDYDFCGESVPYICGMSVPPVMMKRVVARLIESGIFN